MARVLAVDLGFTEGPVIGQDGEMFVTSIDRGCIYQLSEGGASVWAVTGGGPNGATEGWPDTFGTVLYVSQNGGTRPAHRWPGVIGGIQVVHAGGRVEWLTRDPISPNDLCFGPDGFLYLTDPTRGRVQRDDGRVWRCDPRTGEAELLVSLPWYPNGIAFGLEDDAVYVASTGEHMIWRFPIGSDGIDTPEPFVRLVQGMPDGFAFDIDGHLAVAAVGENGRPAQIQIYDRDGRYVDAFELGSSSKVTNIAIGLDGTMLITDADAGTALVHAWPTSGLPLHPFRTAVPV